MIPDLSQTGGVPTNFAQGTHLFVQGCYAAGITIRLVGTYTVVRVHVDDAVIGSRPADGGVGDRMDREAEPVAVVVNTIRILRSHDGGKKRYRCQ